MNTVLTCQEAARLLNRPLTSHDDIEHAAHALLARGGESILIACEQGDHRLFINDYWTDGNQAFWLSKPASKKPNIQQILASDINGYVTKHYSLPDAVILASMHAHQASRLGTTAHWPEDECDIPYLSTKPLQKEPLAFRPYQKIGLYPIVENSDWLQRLLPLGVKTIQLRIKENSSNLDTEIKTSVMLAKKYDATLFINDHWEQAIQYGADGVHLGQNDLDTADVNAIHRAGLLLGISTHCYYEVARAHAIRPSYIACGPIYPTTSKTMPFQPQGIEALQRWRRTLDYPLVAIGGINLQRVHQVLETGINGVALISAISKAHNPVLATEILLKYCKTHAQLR